MWIPAPSAKWKPTVDLGLSPSVLGVPQVPLARALAAVPYLYPTLREKCRQASFRWVSKFARRKFPPHSGQTWGGRFLCIR